MADEKQLPIRSETDILLARQEGRALASRLGFSSSDQVLIATAISEVARNIITHADGGEIVLEIVHRGGRNGIGIIARDQGPGIADIELAMKDGYSTRNGLGIGLPGARRLMDEFDLSSEVGKGTVVAMKKWRA